MKISKKQRLILVLGAILIIASAASPIGAIALWQIDLARGFNQQCVVYHDEEITVTFTQQAHGDLYLNNFLVKSSDGSNSIIQLDHDDSRLWNLKVNNEDNRYYITGWSPWTNSPTSHFNLDTRELYSGRYKAFFTLDGQPLRQEQ